MPYFKDLAELGADFKIHHKCNFFNKPNTQKIELYLTLYSLLRGATETEPGSTRQRCHPYADRWNNITPAQLAEGVHTSANG